MDQHRVNTRSAKRQNDDNWDEVHQQLIEVQQQQAVQKKSLTISNPDDSDEKEADEAAQQVTRGDSNLQPVYGSGETKIQRKEFQATDRITGNGKDLLYSLVDISGNPLMYDKDEPRQGPILLPEGTQVVKLSENPGNNDYVKVIVWMEGKYREGYVLKTAFGGTIAEDSPFAVDAFINDAERTVYNSYMTYEELKQGYAKQDKMMADMNAKSDLENQFVQDKTKFREELMEVENSIKEYKEGKLRITPAMLKNLKEEDQAMMARNKTDQPGVMQDLSNLLYSVYDPGNKGKSTREEILFIPLPPQWLQLYFPGFYKRQWTKKKNSFANLAGNSGFVLANEEKEKFIALLEKVRSKLKGMDDAANSPVGKWILTTDFSKAGHLVIIESNTWNFSNSQLYASEVALNTSFGMLHADPVLTVMAHEMNMAADYTMGETHLPESETKTNWLDADQGGLKTVKDSGRKMDSLFQAHSSTSIIILSTYFKRIRDKQ